MTKKIEILVTNDDGVEALGIKALAKALARIKEVKLTVVAPLTEQSAKSHSLTLHRPLRIIQKKKNIFAVDGTPTDCVMIGCSKIFKNPPDMIISGINMGGNVGDDIHYSGTVAAAFEGGLMGIPSVAISQLGAGKFDFTYSSLFIEYLVRKILKHSLPAGIVLNVNVPPHAKSLEFEITKTGKRNYGDIYVEAKDPRGRPYYWIGGNQYSFHNIKGSDGNAIMAGKISVTPLTVYATKDSFIKTMRGWQW